MKSEIYQALQGTTCLDEALHRLTVLFSQIKDKNPDQRIGYVSGIISSDGDEKLPENIARLSGFTDKLRDEVGYCLFSATDVFGNGLREKVEEMKLPRQQREPILIQFWGNVLKTGYVNDIYMTPRWTESQGARSEYEISKQEGIVVFYREDLG